MSDVSNHNRRVLLVATNPETRRTLSLTLGAWRPEWELTFAEQGTQALTALAQQSYDAFVLFMSDPAQGADPLLAEVTQWHPQTARLLVSDPLRWNASLKCLGTAHYFLLEPCDARTLEGALQRAFEFAAWLPQEAVCRLLARLTRLPSPPTLYFKVVRELRSPTASLEAVGAQIAQDPAMTAKLLQFVNSAVFGLGRTVASASDAVLFLGFETTKSLILMAHSFCFFEGKSGVGANDDLWQHSLATARYARAIAEAEGCDADRREESFTAGLLHDIGKLALASNLTDEYKRAESMAEREGLRSWEAEQNVFGATHAEIGACLLAIWGLSPDIVEALALHHHPVQMLNRGFCPLTAVHAANAFEHEQHQRLHEAGLDKSYLDALGLGERADVWRERCRLAPSS